MKAPKLTATPYLHKKEDDVEYHRVYVRLKKGSRVATFYSGLEAMIWHWDDKGTIVNPTWINNMNEDYMAENNHLAELCLMAFYIEEIYPELDVKGISEMLREPEYGMLVKLGAQAQVAKWSRTSMPNESDKYQSNEKEIQRLGQLVTQLEHIVKELTAKVS
ncbi:hypothetical protein [Hymenobacter convexus]|uniref:hypothetical protein n=1 Tax=Hymenobacter sp. CA1UV-4 TaxID=3063782 RepID=UPI002712CB50|nr:hypothetical protein [Hymenobacter sp. CA1UV-4]MDO7852964.1 hypothetical protein [Hymenobacter sp. CA1UV-4]